MVTYVFRAPIPIGETADPEMMAAIALLLPKSANLQSTQTRTPRQPITAKS